MFKARDLLKGEWTRFVLYVVLFLVVAFGVGAVASGLARDARDVLVLHDADAPRDGYTRHVYNDGDGTFIYTYRNESHTIVIIRDVAAECYGLVSDSPNAFWCMRWLEWPARFAP